MIYLTLLTFLGGGRRRKGRREGGGENQLQFLE